MDTHEHWMVEFLREDLDGDAGAFHDWLWDLDKGTLVRTVLDFVRISNDSNQPE